MEHGGGYRTVVIEIAMLMKPLSREGLRKQILPLSTRAALRDDLPVDLTNRFMHMHK
ncbi:hypothetical protein D9M69_651940 [compost metagenome]